MNERIRELAQQAGLKVESFMTNPPKPFQILSSTEQFEKFAELIVGECFVKLTPYLDDQFIDDIESELKEHFGVKE